MKRFMLMLLCMVLLSGTLLASKIFAVNRLGPSGGKGGRPFSDEKYVKTYLEIDEVRICSGEFIDSIQVTYRDRDGYQQAEGHRHGGDGGSCESFLLRDGEYIVRIFGYHGDLVDSLRIQTNRRTSRKYGRWGGSERYEYSAPRGAEIIGFIGRAGEFVDAIGVLLRPRKR